MITIAKVSSRMSLAVALACAALGCASSSPPLDDASDSSHSKDGGLDADGSLGPDSGAGSNDASDGVDTGVPACVLDGSAGAGAVSGVVASGPGNTGAITQSVAIDGSKGGRVFDGIGAISGGGGNSRLLFDYPEPYRSQVLDYLFKPHFGASLQILKVEIGGDANSTDGSEPSIMHTATDLACNRGWEFWLMQEAKKRNPAIKLYGLSWGAPGWITGGTARSPFSAPATIGYLTKWLDCAKSYGLSIDYIGAQNERGYEKDWYEKLRAALVAGGYPIQIVGGDGDWGVADDMVNDAAFASAIDIIGAHYPCGGDGSDATTCGSTANARKTGKPLWASENGSQDYKTGAAPIARAILRGYLDGQMTSFINWPLVASIPPGLPFETVGLMVADTPWSGAFDAGKSVWVTAQVTQFVDPGWTFIDSASGYIGGNRNNGSYVTLKSSAASSNASDYTILIETSSATSPQTMAIATKDAIAGSVHVWGTNLSADDTKTNLAAMADIVPSNGTYWMTLAPGYFYSVTTTTGQHKGEILSPPASGAALPYGDDFEGRPLASPPRYWCDQDGSFEIATCAASRKGLCLRQAAPVTPIEWAGHYGTPNTILGTNDWRDYTITADVLLEEPGSLELIARYGARDYYNTGHTNGYLLSVTDKGGWSILRNDASGQAPVILTAGTVAALGTKTWHTIGFTVMGNAMTATIDGTQVGTATDPSYDSGPAGLAVGMTSGKWATAQFDNLAITPAASPSTRYTSYLTNRSTGLRLDVAGQGTNEGDLVTLDSSSAATSQMWQLWGDGSGLLQIANLHSGKILVSTAAGGTPAQTADFATTKSRWQLQPTEDGFFRILDRAGFAVGATVHDGVTSVATQAPDCARDQEWALTTVVVPNVSYQIVNRDGGLLLDVAAASTTQGAAIDLWPTTGAANQVWTVRPANGEATFVLVSRNSGLALDVPAATSAEDTSLDQWPITGGGNQAWQLRPTPDGYINLVGQNGLFVDAAGSVATKGAAVVQRASNGKTSQDWSLVPAL